MESTLPIKIFLIGPQKSGKTSFIKWSTQAKPAEESVYQQTIGLQFANKSVKIKDQQIKIQFWEIPEDKYQISVKTYYKSASVFLLMFDISDPQQFERLKEEFANNEIFINQVNSKFCPVMLIGTKGDLEQNVQQNQIKNLAKKTCGYLKTSAKTGYNIQKAIISVVTKRLNNEYCLWPKSITDQPNILKFKENMNLKQIQQKAAPQQPKSINNYTNSSINIKFLLIGAQKAGKSSILNSFIDHQFHLNQQYKFTVGIDFKNKVVKYGSQNYQLQIWDTGGQQRFKTITTCYYKGCPCLYLVYDCTNLQEFMKLGTYLKLIDQYAVSKRYVCLTGTKCDLQNQKKVSTEMGVQFASQNGMDFMQVTALYPDQVIKLFMKGVEWYSQHY